MFRCMGCMNEYDESIVDICPHCGYSRHTKATESYHLPPEIILQGRYIVGKVLGFGGFGVTYIGFDAELERTVAIKEYLPSAFATRLPGDTYISVYQGEATNQYKVGLQRFVEEAQTLAQFNGIQGVVDIYDSFMSNNSAYIIMQFIRGKDVKKILRDEGVLSYERARTIILSICDTLAPIHAKGMIHRDISPDNIYITDEGEIKLLDFGAARYESSVNSKSLSVILKSGYAPEEQYRSKGEQGSWTDVYALAATFYKMIAGRTPQDSMERAINDELQEPSKLGVELPVSSENAILNALGVRKGDRTQTVTEFKEALLSDGVERIIVKPVRHDKAGLPLGAKIALGVGAFIFVGLAIFTAAGGFENTTIIGGTTLEDSFGSVDSSAYATVPNLVGLSQEEALASLQEVGLEGEIGEWNFSAPEQGEYITEQGETAGSQQLLGNTITYTLNVGNPMEAMEAGLIPDILAMEYVEAIDFLDEARWSDTYYIVEFEYSTEDEKGHIVGINYEDISPEDDSDYMLYVISIGIGPEDTLSSDGNMELAYVSDRIVNLVVGSSTRDLDEVYYRYYVNLYVSIDEGDTWKLINGNLELRNYYADEDETSIKVGTIEIFDSIEIYQEMYSYVPLEFKVERMDYDTGTMIDSIVVEGSTTVVFGDELAIESVEELSPDEANQAYLDGVVGSSQDYQFSDSYCLESGHTTYWKLIGDFDKDYSYEIVQISGMNSSYPDSEYVNCEKNGELYIAWEITDLYTIEEIEFALYCDVTFNSEIDGVTVSERGMPAYITLPESTYADYQFYEEMESQETFTEEEVSAYEYAIIEEKFNELMELYGEDFITELSIVAGDFQTEEEFFAWLMENY